MHEPRCEIARLRELVRVRKAIFQGFHLSTAWHVGCNHESSPSPTMAETKNLQNVPTWRPLSAREEPREMESGVFPVEPGPRERGGFEPVIMPRQSVRARGSKVAPLRARLRRA